MELSTWCIASFCVFIHFLIKKRAETNRDLKAMLFADCQPSLSLSLSSKSTPTVQQTIREATPIIHILYSLTKEKKYAWTNLGSISDARAKKKIPLPTSSRRNPFFYLFISFPFVGTNQPCTIRHDVFVFVFFHKRQMRCWLVGCTSPL